MSYFRTMHEKLAPLEEEVERLTAALAAREAEVARLRGTLERIDAMVRRHGTGGIRTSDFLELTEAALAAPPPGDGAGGGEAR